MEIGELSGLNSAQVQTALNVKLAKGAMEQEAQVIMTLLNGATGGSRQEMGFETGHNLDVVA